LGRAAVPRGADGRVLDRLADKRIARSRVAHRKVKDRV
jgi:hypothetical protein